MGYFDKAFKEYKAKSSEFTRNNTDVEWGGVYKSLNGEYLCSSIKQPAADYKYKFSPMYYNFETIEIVVLDSLEGNQKGWTILPEDKYISLIGPSNVWFKVMLTDNGKTMPLHEWIKEKTGTDISDFHFGSFRDKLTWTTYEDVFVCFPFFSADGNTMISTTWLNNEYLTSIIRFSNNIFGDVQTEIKGELVSTFNVQGPVINSSSAIVDIYTFDGMKVNTFNVSGTLNLTEVLAKDIKDKEDNKTNKFKLIIG